METPRQPRRAPRVSGSGRWREAAGVRPRFSGSRAYRWRRRNRRPHPRAARPVTRRSAD